MQPSVLLALLTALLPLASASCIANDLTWDTNGERWAADTDSSDVCEHELNQAYQVGAAKWGCRAHGKGDKAVGYNFTVEYVSGTGSYLLDPVECHYGFASAVQCDTGGSFLSTTKKFRYTGNPIPRGC